MHQSVEYGEAVNLKGASLFPILGFVYSPTKILGPTEAHFLDFSSPLWHIWRSPLVFPH